MDHFASHTILRPTSADFDVLKGWGLKSIQPPTFTWDT